MKEKDKLDQILCFPQVHEDIFTNFMRDICCLACKLGSHVEIKVRTLDI